jgi:hypothetical protein
MRLAALSLSLLTLALAGCGAFAPEPDVETLPHAAVVDTHVETTPDRVDTFRLMTVNGRNVVPIVDQPAKLIGIDGRNLIPAGRGVHLEFEGFGFYRSTVRRMFWNPMRVEGGVDFTPAAGATYAVHGSVTSTLSTVWLENEATHEVIGQKASMAHDIPPASDPVDTFK